VLLAVEVAIKLTLPFWGYTRLLRAHSFCAVDSKRGQAPDMEPPVDNETKSATNLYNSAHNPTKLP
jgi:hypothetical protein